MADGIKVGDTVQFTDEHGEAQTGTVVRLVPVGKYSRDCRAVAIQGSYGAYFRTVDKVEKIDHGVTGSSFLP